MARHAFDGSAFEGIVPGVVMQIIGAVGVRSFRIPNRQISIEAFGNRAFAIQTKGSRRRGGGHFGAEVDRLIARQEKRLKELN